MLNLDVILGLKKDGQDNISWKLKTKPVEFI